MALPHARSWLVAVALAVSTGCASERPWKVSADEQRRFDQSRDACDKLTDAPDAFDKCMQRRGWRREWVFGL